MMRLLLTLSLALPIIACSASNSVPGPANSCSGDHDCERPLACLRGSCLQKICEPGELRCLGNDLEICGLDGQGFGLKTACQAGCNEETTSCTDPVCEPFATRCYEGKVEQCLANGSAWNLLEECDQGCESGACVRSETRICEPESTRCSGRNLETCNTNGTGWVHTEVCNHGCGQEGCAPAPCNMGVSRCDGDQLEVCNGSGWVWSQGCDYGCRGGNCMEAACEEDARRCVGLDLETCAPDQRSWLYRRTCESGCDQETAACLDGIPEGGCTPNRSRCNGDVQERCNDQFTWEFVQQCAAACMQGSCTSCRPGEARCNEDQPQVCGDNGAGYDNVGEACDVICLEGDCGSCVPGTRRCNGANIELCGADGGGYNQLSACLTSCADGACTLCSPGAVRCFGRTVQTCAEDGGEWLETQQCGGQCRDGACQGEVVCAPDTPRCVGQDREICAPGGGGWLVRESCMESCEGGTCIGAACLPLQLNSTPAQLPADGISSALISSGLILAEDGTLVPDGSLFTLSTDGGTLLAEDGDPNTPGVQVRSLRGRIDFAVRAPGLNDGQIPDPITVRAEHPVAGRCAGTARISFSEPGAVAHRAIDFTAAEGNDPEVTNALWDTALGRVDPFPSNFGAGEDGVLVVDGTYNINQHSQPGRLHPDGVNYIVNAIGQASVTINAGVGGVEIGDEVLLMNLQGDGDNHGNVGNYEILEIARIHYGQNTIYFSTNLTKIYGATDSNEELTGQKIMLQRVPRYRSLRVNGTLTADAWNGEKGGVLFVKVMGDADIRGSLSMNNKGYRHMSNDGESYNGLLDLETPTAGGGAGHRETYPDASRDGWDHGWSSYCGGGGAYGSRPDPLQDCHTGGRTVWNGSAGQTYGTPELDQWHLGSGGGSASSVHMRCCGWRHEHHRRHAGGHGGGQIVLWASGISVRGNVETRSSGHFAGSGGMVFLRARSMNVGNNLVNAQGGSRGGAGRIRLDFFGLSGQTSPAHHPGFAGDTVMQTDDLSGVGNPLTEVTLSRVLADLRGGSINYQISNGATDAEQNLIWNDIAPGETFSFPENQPGTALRMRATFVNDNLQPLALIGLSLSWTRSQ